MWLVRSLLVVAGLTKAQVVFPGQTQDNNRQPTSSNSQFSGSSSSSSGGIGGRFGGSSCCQPAVGCSSFLFTSAELTRSACTLPDGEAGLCCDSRTSSGSSRRTFTTVDDNDIGIRSTSSFTTGDISQAIQKGRSSLRNITSARFGTPSRRSGAFFHARFQSQKSNKEADLGSAGLLLQATARELVQSEVGIRQGGIRDDSAVNFGSPSLGRQILGNSCPTDSVTCSRGSQYRTFDGSCNNEREVVWGKESTALNRLIEPQYADGVQSPRLSRTGRSLPSARLLSSQLTTDLDNPDSTFSVLTMAFGQFTDHDITHVPIMQSGSGQDIDCCSNVPGSEFDNVCHPISIPQGDRQFPGKSCMNLVRSLPAPALDCSVRYREQMNQITHWLDLSVTYGSTDEEARSLRTFRNGILRSGSNDMLPDDVGSDNCIGTCFKAGDGRVNEQPGLNTLHHIWLREHNRLARDLQQLNPNWNDERVFQEARKINIAEFQHILYNEWLPKILGKQFMNTFGLAPLTAGYSNDYDQNIDPRINNEFAAAAFRFGHSLIAGVINVYNRVGREVNPSFRLKDAFLKPDILRLDGVIDGVVAGFTRDPMQQFDSGFSSDITNNLFDGDRNGMDLVSLNIQRGRDHGLQGYNQYRELCGMGKVSSFSGLSDVMSQQRVIELQNLYESPDDIDLFVGVFSERPRSGAIVGPITLCIVGDQFARLKKGDRFFYEHRSGGFTESQLSEIRKSSMSRLLCDNSGVSQLQPLAFIVPTSFNPVISCNNKEAIPTVNLGPWAENTPRRG